VYRAQRHPRRGLPDDLTGHDGEPLLRLGPAGVSFAAMGVGSGHQDIVVAGGVESMSRVPMGADGGGIDGNNLELRKKLFQVPQGISADLIATRGGFTREDLDGFACASQARAEIAQKEGRFARSLVPVRDPATGKVVLEVDEYPRRGPPSRPSASSSPRSWAMGAAPVGPERRDVRSARAEAVPRPGRDPAPAHRGQLERHRRWRVCGAARERRRGGHARAASAGAHPRDGDGGRRAGDHADGAPTPASARALERAGMEAKDIDLWEINEAFAVVPLETMKNLGISHEKVNVNGGAIALGHPLGATGAILLSTAVDELERRDLATALVTLCIGGGMGIAVIVERV
jgi:acetyl-CoA C-acetyltransferase